MQNEEWSFWRKWCMRNEEWMKPLREKCMENAKRMSHFGEKWSTENEERINLFGDKWSIENEELMKPFGDKHGYWSLSLKFEIIMI